MKGGVMKVLYALSAGVAIAVAAVLAFTRPASSTASAAPRAAAACSLASLPRATRAQEQSLYGHITSLTLRGGRYALRFDPAWHLTGVTAATAAAADGVVQPGEAVPNDNDTRDESHRLLTFLVPASSPVTILTRSTCSTRVTVARLASRIPRAGFWIRVRIDTARSIDQQYQP
jgi:hypothetical protein